MSELPENFFSLSSYEREEILNKMQYQLDNQRQDWYNNNNTCKLCGGPINEPKYPTHTCKHCRVNIRRWGTHNGRSLTVSHLLALGVNLHNIYKTLDAPELKLKIRPINKLIKNLEKRYSDGFNYLRYGLKGLNAHAYPHILLATYHMTQQAGGYIDLGQPFKSYMVYCAFGNDKLRDSRNKRMEFYDQIFVNTGLFKMLLEIYPLWKEVMLGNKMLKPHYEKGDYTPFMSF